MHKDDITKHDNPEKDRTVYHPLSDISIQLYMVDLGTHAQPKPGQAWFFGEVRVACLVFVLCVRIIVKLIFRNRGFADLEAYIPHFSGCEASHGLLSSIQAFVSATFGQMAAPAFSDLESISAMSAWQ